MTVELHQVRKYFSETSTISELFYDGRFVCFLLEDKDRGLQSDWDLARIKAEKVYGKTAIPTGEYSIQITYSPKYKKDMPQVMNVKGFEGIRIHSGNVADHSEGCLLPGLTMKQDFVGNSREAVAKLYTIIKTNLDAKREVRLKITRKN